MNAACNSEGCGGLSMEGRTQSNASIYVIYWHTRTYMYRVHEAAGLIAMDGTLQELEAEEQEQEQENDTDKGAANGKKAGTGGDGDGDGSGAGGQGEREGKKKEKKKRKEKA